MISLKYFFARLGSNTRGLRGDFQGISWGFWLQVCWYLNVSLQVTFVKVERGVVALAKCSLVLTNSINFCLLG
ncbi:hypothetical protein CWC15_02865 [Pseudoalteromonas spongiae]|nr:hypothetical protein CWC15_02865 [Pseudoalteromonas spongiae]